MTTHFETLGIPPRATEQEVRAAYLKLAKENHPDKPGNGPDSAERFRAITHAYGVLSNGETRRAYVKQLILTSSSTSRAARRTCAACGGEGKQYLQVTFARREPRPCPDCNGSGYE